MTKKNKEINHDVMMRLAIEEMHKSIAEHDDRTDPKVGVVLINSDGRVIGLSHRGELRNGDHAEFTLLDRKNVDKDLTGCILYTTLEPCTEHSRTFPKLGCAVRIANARINEVFVGIEDPDPTVWGKGIGYLKGRGIKVHMFPLELQEIIREENAKFIQEAEERAKQAKEEIKVELGLLEKPAEGFTIKDFSQEAIQQLITTASLPFVIESTDFYQWAIKFGLIERQNQTNQFRPTGLGLLLFGREPESQFPQSILKVEIDYGNDKTEIKDFKGPLVLQLPMIIEFVKDKALRLTINRTSAERTEESEFPIDVLREVIANAIIHRDYTIEGAANYLYISSEKIIVRSPGSPVPPLTIDDLNNFTASMLSRNPKIMYIFVQMRMAEARGIGIRRMKELYEKYGFPTPVFSMEGVYLQVVLGRTKESLKVLIGEEKDSELNAEERQGLTYIHSMKRVTKKQYGDHFSFDNKKAQRHLLKFKKHGLVRQEGKGKAISYVFRT